MNSSKRTHTGNTQLEENNGPFNIEGAEAQYRAELDEWLNHAYDRSGNLLRKPVSRDD